MIGFFILLQKSFTPINPKNPNSDIHAHSKLKGLENILNFGFNGLKDCTDFLIHLQILNPQIQLILIQKKSVKSAQSFKSVIQIKLFCGIVVHFLQPALGIETESPEQTPFNMHFQIKNRQGL